MKSKMVVPSFVIQLEEKVANLKAQLEQSLPCEEAHKLRESHEKELEMLQKVAEERADQTSRDHEELQLQLYTVQEKLDKV